MLLTAEGAARRPLGVVAGWLVLATAAIVVGCGGSGTSAQDPEDDSGGSDGSGGASDGDPGAECDVAPGRVGLQRLTRAEYNRTVRDLFGITSTPADVFPPDSATSSFDNNAASLTVSPQLAELLLDAAEQVAAEAVANMPAEDLACVTSDAACTRALLSGLALRVYRRPASEAELADLEDLVQDAAAEGEDGGARIEHAITGMLMSPQFLYRNVPAAGSAPLEPGQIVALDDYEIATRLSYLLWGSTPDDDLLARAGDGELRQRDTLRAQFERMLADPKAAALYDGFFRQWLQLGRLGSATPDPEVFPQWSDELRAEMDEEARLFFEGLLERDGSALEILTSTQTWANEAIAELYGVDGPTGPWFQPITTDPTQRAGVLTMPAILAMTSGPRSPSIVKRGVWLAEAILCAAPLPPPAAVPAEPTPEPGETERERLARHRVDPSCASCHDLIDPLGFGFERYDAIGRWRDDIDGAPVDDLGELPGGNSFQGVVELAGLLAERDEFRSCVTQKLMTYALGRTMTGDDACVVSAIGDATVTPDSTFSDLLWAVVTSDAFSTEQIVGDP